MKGFAMYLFVSSAALSKWKGSPSSLGPLSINPSGSFEAVFSGLAFEAPDLILRGSNSPLPTGPPGQSSETMNTLRAGRF